MKKKWHRKSTILSPFKLGGYITTLPMNVYCCVSQLGCSLLLKLLGSKNRQDGRNLSEKALQHKFGLHGFDVENVASRYLL